MNSLAEHQFPAEVVELAFSELFAFIEQSFSFFL